jgi:hypothetical protein
MGLTTLAKALIGVVLPVLLFGAFVIVRRDCRMIVEARLTLWGCYIALASGSVDSSGQQRYRWAMAADFIFIHHVQRYTDAAVIAERSTTASPRAGRFFAVDGLLHSGGGR